MAFNALKISAHRQVLPEQVPRVLINHIVSVVELGRRDGPRLGQRFRLLITRNSSYLGRRTEAETKKEPLLHVAFSQSL